MDLGRLLLGEHTTKTVQEASMPVAKKLGFNPRTFPSFKTSDKSTLPMPMQGLSDMGALYVAIVEDRRQKWKQVIEDFEEDPNFFNSYQYLQHHPLFYRFAFAPSRPKILHERDLSEDRGMDSEICNLGVYKVDPATGRPNDSDESKNTQVRFHFEAGPTRWKDQGGEMLDYQQQLTIDPDLCVSAQSYEQAVIYLALRVHEVYGNDRTKAEL